jgi:radical SAM superfamily enzyme
MDDFLFYEVAMARLAVKFGISCPAGDSNENDCGCQYSLKSGRPFFHLTLQPYFCDPF